MSRQLERLLHIDELLRSTQRQTADSLAIALEVSERTVRNDLNFLRDRYGAFQPDFLYGESPPPAAAFLY